MKLCDLCGAKRVSPCVYNLASTNDRRFHAQRSSQKTDHRHRWPGGRGQEHDCFAARAQARLRQPGERRHVPRARTRAIENDTSFEDEAALLKLAEASRIQLEPTLGGNRTLLDGKDVSARIRERDVTEAASRVSVHPKVREWMVEHQRALGAKAGIVMEGRDIGTKVFPDADLKIFLDADPVVREERRRAQQKIKGEVAANVAAELRERDQRDRTRAASPLVAASDAVVIDSSSMSEDDVLARIEKLVEQKRQQRPM